jgi:TonB family protein
MSNKFFSTRARAFSTILTLATVSTSGAVAAPLITVTLPATLSAESVAGYTPETAIPVRVRHLATPEYPQTLIKKGIEGQVDVRAQIDQDGRVTEATIERADPPAIAQAQDAVLHSLRAASFYPVIANGKSTDASVIVPFRFQLVEKTVSTFPFKRVVKSRVAHDD